MKLKIAINTHHKGKHPPTLTDKAKEAWFRWFNGRFRNRVVTIEQLAEAIQNGYAIAPQHKGYRKAATFTAAQHVGIDLDDGSMSFEQVLAIPIVAQHAAIVHTTASHTADHPRLRVIFILDRPIGNPEKYKLLVKSILHYFGVADPMCKDACRLFFGAPDCELVNLGNVLSLDTAAALFVDPYQAMQAYEAQARADALQGREVVGRGDVSAAVLERHSSALLRRVEGAPDGEKYVTLRDISRTFGGYVAGGYYALGEVVNWLKGAIETRRHEVKDMAHAYQTIEQWVRLGMDDPLYFEARPKAATAAGGLPRSNAWRQHALDARIAELEALILELPVGAEVYDPVFADSCKEYDKLMQARYGNDPAGFERSIRVGLDYGMAHPELAQQVEAYA